jgi:WD40 repeat protein
MIAVVAAHIVAARARSHARRPTVPLQAIRSITHRHWWLPTIALLILGWWLTRPDGPERFQPDLRPIFAVSTDGRLIATDREIWDTRNGRVLRAVPRLGEKVFSLDGEFLAIHNIESSLTIPQVHDPTRLPIIDIVRTIDQSPPISVTLRSLSIGSLALNATGTWLAVSTGYRGPDALRIYNTQTGQAITIVQPENQAIGQLQFTPDARYLLAAGFPAGQIIDTQTWQTVLVLPAGTIGFSEARQLLAIHNARSFTLIALPDAVAQPPQRLSSPYSSNDGFAFSPDGEYLAVINTSGSGGAALWSMNTGPRESLPVRMALVRVADGAIVQRFEGPKGAMGLPTFTPDGQQIMTIGPGSGLTFWRAAPCEPWEQQVRMLPFWIAPVFPLVALVRRVVGWWRRRAA